MVRLVTSSRSIYLGSLRCLASSITAKVTSGQMQIELSLTRIVANQSRPACRRIASCPHAGVVNSFHFLGVRPKADATSTWPDLDHIRSARAQRPSRPSRESRVLASATSACAAPPLQRSGLEGTLDAGTLPDHKVCTCQHSHNVSVEGLRCNSQAVATTG